ncbi:hypothetical protein ScPMuIL_002051 [Solemya velum]
MAKSELAKERKDYHGRPYDGKRLRIRDRQPRGRGKNQGVAQQKLGHVCGEKKLLWEYTESAARTPRTRTIMELPDLPPRTFSGISEGDSEEYEDGWKFLPDILLEDVFTMLAPKARHEASQVCQRWYGAFYAPRVWETFTLKERTLTKKRFNLYRGYQREVCPRKTQVCLLRVGSHFKKIVIPPISDFYNLYEFIRVVDSFMGFFEEFPMPMLNTFHFTFACESRGMTGKLVHGTGGKLLEVLKSLLSNMRNMKNLKLNQLLLDEYEITDLINSIAKRSSHSLKYFELLNCSRTPYALHEVSKFENLQKLVISPQHMTEIVLLLLAGMGLTELHLVQDAYTCAFDPVSSEAWKMAKEIAPFLSVTLEVRGDTKSDIAIQPHAPVTTIVYNTPYSKTVPDTVSTAAYYYRNTLESYEQRCLPRVHGPRSFVKRGDSSLLDLVQRCRRIHTLVIRERISTATLLLLAKEGKTLRNLIVRQNALIKKCDWPNQWTDEFYDWLRTSSHSFEATNQEVARIVGPPWRPLSDHEFKYRS